MFNHFIIISISCFVIFGCSSKPKQKIPACLAKRFQSNKAISNEIKVNTIGLKKRLVFSDRVRGTIKNIQNVEWRGNRYFAVIGQTGVWLLSPNDYQVIRKIEYKDEKGETIWFGLSPFILDIDNDGEFEIAQRGGGYGKVGLLDDNGKKIWEFKPKILVHPIKMVVGDINKDKTFDFYIIDNDYLYKLDASKKEIWKKAGHFTDINTLSINDTTFLITSFDDTVKIWDIAGKEVKKISYDRKIYWFDIFENNGINYLVRLLDDKFIIFDLSGNKIFTDTLPTALGYHGPKCMLIDSKNKVKDLLAISTTSSTSLGKGLLSIYDLSDWKLVYQEVLGTTEGINVNEGRLLLGDGKNKLWEYYF